jgi:hypothetical protein
MEPGVCQKEGKGCDRRETKPCHIRVPYRSVRSQVRIHHISTFVLPITRVSFIIFGAYFSIFFRQGFSVHEKDYIRRW